MNYRFFKKKLLKGISHTCLHPQWFVYKNKQKYYKKIVKNISGRILDIGCADQIIRQYLPPDSDYIGLDYYLTATEWYKTNPNIFGDAQQLPFTEQCVDCVLLLDVLEHIADPHRCLSEISRVLKNGGIFVLQVPFLYPIHDAPLDFQRWTSYGLFHLVKKNGFVVKEECSLGKSIETGGLLLNLALCKLMLNWFRNKNPALLLSVIIVPAIVLINILCWMLAFVAPIDNFMPHGYRITLEKHSCDTSSS